MKKDTTNTAPLPEHTIDVNNPLPIDVDDASVVFGGAGGALRRMLPPRDQLPEEFRRRSDPWCDVADRWFFNGLNASELRPKPGIDAAKALRHLRTIMGSFEPKHEHKIGGVGFLMSRWFEPIEGTPGEGAAKEVDRGE